MHLGHHVRIVLLASTLVGGCAQAWAEATFACSITEFKQTRSQLEAVFDEWSVPPQAWQWNGTTARLKQPDTSTLDLAIQWALRPEIFDRGPGFQPVLVASRAEIALTLMAEGRQRQYPCTLEVFRQEVELRQSVVGWASMLEWEWPDGEAAHWNTKLWDQGTPVGGKAGALQALRDAFQEQDLYGLGCYTATKMVYAQAYLDYYARKKPLEFSQALDTLAGDGEPLVDVEPGRSWCFQEDFDPKSMDTVGKILRLSEVAPESFVPGDWAYILNSDVQSARKIGYEGSNIVYLGGGRFNDYYNDNDHSYSYREKLDEVWQWRNGVFSRSNDASKIQPLSPEDIQRLGRTPEDGGLVMKWRAFPAPLSELTRGEDSAKQLHSARLRNMPKQFVARP